MNARPIAVLAMVLTLVAACGPLTGDLGSVAPPASTAQPSIELPSAEPTPGQVPGASETPAPSGGPSATPTPDATPSPTTSGTTTVRAYFFLGSFVDNAGLVPVLREVPKTQAVGAAAMRALLEGPNDAELGARPAMYTVIPEGTRFLGLTIDDGIATVNLSREFEQGGGSASVLGRLAQVVYTLTQFPTIESVKFELDGEPVTVFSGEGVVLDAPVDRADYVDQLPAIFVDRPAWGGVLANPARVRGHGQRLRSDLPPAAARWRRPLVGQPPGNGHLRNRLLGHLRRDPRLQRLAGRLGHPPGLRSLREGRLGREPHGIPRLAHAVATPGHRSPLTGPFGPTPAGALRACVRCPRGRPSVPARQTPTSTGCSEDPGISPGRR